MYYLVDLKCLKPVSSGEGEELKRVKEKYLVDAMSVTEAESRITEWCPDNYQEMEVKGAAFFDLDSVIKTGDDEQFYLGRVRYPEENEKSGKVKWKSFQVMVNGSSLANALENMENHFADGVESYQMFSIATSQIIVDEDLAKID